MDFDADIENLTNLEMSFDTENGSAPGMNVDVVTKLNIFKTPRSHDFVLKLKKRNFKV